jgi:sulfite reductase (NADPH) flavoprotein alpha-component
LKDEQQVKQYTGYSDVLDMLRDFPAMLSPRQLIGLLPSLQHRLYSIASSPALKAGQVDITVRAVKIAYRDRLRKGACSVQPGDRFQVDDTVNIFVKPNTQFRLPQNTGAPVIMIGAGTGIAPFRAFLQHRQETKAGGANWLFYGDRRRESDFLYKKEMESFYAREVLTNLDLAFSREGTHKRYVQHALYEKRKEVLQWLRNGAHIYVCGLLNMADDVQQCMTDMLMAEKGYSRQQAQEYLHTLKVEKRYCVDAY